jgi:ABC-type Fe3+-hydroxamate transport system substrate-binding protein
LGEEFTYKEMRDVGSLFKVNVEPLITEMKADFKLAKDLVSTANNMKPLTAVWVDCVWDCGKREEIYVGAGSGTPNMLMEKAGLTNVFKDKPGLWVYVNGSDIVKKNPDVIILVDWKRDPALATKITWLHGDKQFCEMDALKAARYITVPFSASGAGPRNGAAALDLATAALHVKQGLKISNLKSGISSFTPTIIEEHLKTKTGMVCSMKQAEVKYDTSAGSIHCDVKQSMCMPAVDFLRVLKATTMTTTVAIGYPVSYTNCAVPHTLTKAPERIIAMNQGVLEFMLGLGLGDKIIGSRPLDDPFGRSTRRCMIRFRASTPIQIGGIIQMNPQSWQRKLTSSLALGLLHFVQHTPMTRVILRVSFPAQVLDHVLGH